MPQHPKQHLHAQANQSPAYWLTIQRYRRAGTRRKPGHVGVLSPIATTRRIGIIRARVHDPAKAAFDIPTVCESCGTDVKRAAGHEQ